MKHSHWLMQESLQLLSCGLLNKITPPSRPIRSNNNNVLPVDVFPRLAPVAPLGLLHDWLFSLLTFAVIGQRIAFFFHQHGKELKWTMQMTITKESSFIKH